MPNVERASTRVASLSVKADSIAWFRKPTQETIMKGSFAVRLAITLFSLILGVSATMAQPASDTIVARDDEAAGVKLHYLTAGHGPAVILLHGYTQTSRMWRPIIPLLAEKFTVIAPDLPGIGDSEISKDGLDMKTAAIRIHALATSLGVENARVVGHDIGLMVAYAYAAQFPAETEKLVVMDTFLPGVEGWKPFTTTPYVALPFPRPNPGNPGKRTRANLFFLLLE
jgi:pimeloyl-ACP methyl ester carboxylesterase